MRCIALVLALLAAPALAQTGAGTASDAIGRVNIAGYNKKGACTGALVAPKLVLTASHCVLNDDGSSKRVSDMVFVAGWTGAGHSGASRIARFETHPRAVKDGRIDPAHDLAILILTDPIDIEPVEIGSAAPDGPLTLAGYGWSRPHRLTAIGGCTGAEFGRYWRVDCPVETGQSGGPVLFGEGDARRIVAVIVGRIAENAVVVPVDGWVRATLASAR